MQKEKNPQKRRWRRIKNEVEKRGNKMDFSTKQTWNFNEVKWIATLAEFIVIYAIRKSTQWVFLLIFFCALKQQQQHATIVFPFDGRNDAMVKWSWNAFLLLINGI